LGAASALRLPISALMAALPIRILALRGPWPLRWAAAAALPSTGDRQISDLEGECRRKIVCRAILKNRKRRSRHTVQTV
jgi:hypothetical protein